MVMLITNTEIFLNKNGNKKREWLTKTTLFFIINIFIS